MRKLDIRDILNIDFLIFIFVVITTPWTWKILNNNILICLLLILIAYIFLKLLLIKRIIIELIILFGLAFLVVSVINLQLGFDQQLDKLDVNEEVKLNERHRYYAKDLGAFFLNKYSLNYYKNYNPYFYKFQRNFFSVLDSNLYFFASHPRERAGINEFVKFPSLYLVFFILGIIYSLKLRSLLVIVYLLVAALINGFLSPAFELGPILFFPFVTALTALGVIYSISLLKFLIKKIRI